MDREHVMMANIMLTAQLVTLFMLGWLISRAAQLTKHTTQIDEAIKSYRREIEWLGARIDEIEKSRRAISSK